MEMTTGPRLSAIPWTKAAFPFRENDNLFGPAGRQRVLQLVSFHASAGADQMAIAVHVVDAPHRRPEFMLAGPGRRESGLLARIGTVPFIRNDGGGCVRR